MAEVNLPSKEEVLKSIESKPVKPLGEFKQVRRPFGRRLADAFIGKDVPNIGEYIFFTALIPTLKRVICDIGRDLPEMIFYGRVSNTDPRRYGGTNYTAYSRVGVSPSVPKVNMYGQPIQQQPSSVMFDDITSTDARALETLREEMLSRIQAYGRLTIAEVNEMIGAPITPTDNNWGWTDLRTSDIRQNRNGWVLMMPRAQSLVK